jgi:xanthine/CO dehydrogenase XdhC/CoxF family maturation factor
MDELERALAATLARGQAVAVATVVAGEGAGNRLLVWPAGHTRGDLGQPRLNQRAALYAEALLDKGKFPPAARKQFDGVAGSVEVAFEFHAGRRGPAAGESP